MSCAAVKLPQITQQGVVVMGTGIGDTVFFKIVGQMRIIAPEKGKLKNSHAGKTAVINKFLYLWRNVSEILGDYKLFSRN